MQGINATLAFTVITLFFHSNDIYSQTSVHTAVRAYTQMHTFYTKPARRLL